MSTSSGIPTSVHAAGGAVSKSRRSRSRRQPTSVPTTSPCSSPCPPIEESVGEDDGNKSNYESFPRRPLYIPPPPQQQQQQQQYGSSSSSSPSPRPRFLDGVLYQRTARNRYRYKPRHLTIDLEDGGTLLCRRDVESTLQTGQNGNNKDGNGCVARPRRRRSVSGRSSSIGSVVISERKILQTLSASSSSDFMHQQQTQRCRTFSSDDATIETFQPDFYGPATTYASLLADTGTDIDDVKLYLPSDVAWKMVDVENDESLFVIEIPLPLPQDCIVCSSRRDVSDGGSLIRQSSRLGRMSFKRSSRVKRAEDHRLRASSADSIEAFIDDDLSEEGTDGKQIARSLDDFDERLAGEDSTDSLGCTDSIVHDVDSAQSYHHIYFRCPGGGNEKSLWLRVARKLGRLSSSPKRRISRTFVGSVQRRKSRWRKFEAKGVDGSSDARKLDRMLSVRQSDFAETLLLETSLHQESDDRNVTSTANGAVEEEFKVYPTYVYPHRWMTNEELTHEMLGPSQTFHDLREQTQNVLIGGSPPGKEIGRLELEVLCCCGLPKLDRWSNTDAVCYAVCGPYAFCTDVIREKNHPIWPRKARRACIFPLHNAFAQVFVGVFDDDGAKQHDDFAGRIELDLSRLRPCCTYDVTLPLRLSSEVYMRRGRGTIRLRFRLLWENEQSAVMSYFPKRGAIATAVRSRVEMQVPPPTVTLHCSDAKSFRNVAITVYGAHMPTKFSQKVFRATVREFNLYRKTLQLALKKRIKDISCWRNPLVSLYVFIAWMHCVRNSSVALCLPYALGSLLFLFVRNYLRYNVNDKAHWGYAPLTFEELCASLLVGRAAADSSRRYMEPLDVEMERSSSAMSVYDPGIQGRGSFNQFFAFVGFLPDDFDRRDTCNDDHLEFPFSDGQKYAKLKLDEAYNRYTKKKSKDGLHNVKVATSMLDVKKMRRFGSQSFESDDEDDDDEEDWYERQRQEDILREIPFAVNAGREAIQKNAVNVIRAAGEGVGDAVNVIKAAGEGVGAEVTGTLAKVTHQQPFGSPDIAREKRARKQEEPPIAAKLLQSRLEKSKNVEAAAERAVKDQVSHQRILSFDSIMLPAHAKNYGKEALDSACLDGDGKVNESMMPARERVPEQDADVSDGKKKPLREDMIEIHEKMMTNTFYLFDNRVYITRDGAGASSSRSEPTVNGKQDSELRKMIGLAGPTNPVSARLADYLGPIVNILHFLNQIARAIFNIFMWKDPFLSFWASWMCLFFVLLSVVFPYRIFAFISGIAFVGPQNLLIRLWRVRYPTASPRVARDELDSLKASKGTKAQVRDSESAPVLKQQRRRMWKRRNQNDAEPIEDRNASSAPQFSFSSHSCLVDGKMPQQVASSDDYEIIIPYSRFRRHRFYDWPPDPTVSRVTIDNEDNNMKATSEQQQQQQQQQQRHYEGDAVSVDVDNGYAAARGAVSSANPTTGRRRSDFSNSSYLRQRRRRRRQKAM